MNNKTLALIGGGCVLVACLCVVCLGGVYFFGQSQLGQISSQLGIPSDLNPVAGQPTAAPVSGAPTAVPFSAATTAAPPSGGGNPLEALTKAFTSWGSVKSFRARMSVSGAPAAAQTMTMEMVMPDRIHMTSAQFEMILIGNASYVKIGNTWQKMTLPQSVDVNQFKPGTWQTQIQGGLPDIKILGPDTVDGVPTIVYQFSSAKSSGQEAATKVWIGVTDGFPHKIESGTAVMTFYDFNANIAINPPIP